MDRRIIKHHSLLFSCIKPQYIHAPKSFLKINSSNIPEILCSDPKELSQEQNSISEAHVNKMLLTVCNGWIFNIIIIDFSIMYTHFIRTRGQMKAML